MPEEEKELTIKDPYLKPVIYGGLIITMLTIVFAPAIFLWSMVGGFVAIRMANKFLKKVSDIGDSLLAGLFSGIIGGTFINIIAVLSIKSPENKKILTNTLEKNWPKDMEPIPNFAEILPSILLTTCLIIILVCILFSVFGSAIAYQVSKMQSKKGKA